MYIGQEYVLHTVAHEFEHRIASYAATSVASGWGLALSGAAIAGIKLYVAYEALKGAYKIGTQVVDVCNGACGY